MKQHKIEIGSGDVVVIDKLFGPAIFANLRITADSGTYEWIVERQRIDTNEWVRVAVIPAQLDEEFPEEENVVEE